jgi:hypothetical protein
MTNEILLKFKYKACWNKVRERVLERDLACVHYMLAISRDSNYQFLSEFEVLLMDIEDLNCNLSRCSENAIIRAYEQFKLDLYTCIRDTDNSLLPDAEACAIALAWLSILQDV